MSSSSENLLVNDAQLTELVEVLGEEKVKTLLHGFNGEIENFLQSLTTPSGGNLPSAEIAHMAHHAAGSAALLGAQALRSKFIAFEKTVLSSSEPIRRDDVETILNIWTETQQLIQHCWHRHTVSLLTSRLVS